MMTNPTIHGAGAGVRSQDLNGPAVVDSSSSMRKYGEERSKRLRSDGVGQYIDPSKSDKYRHMLDD